MKKHLFILMLCSFVFLIAHSKAFADSTINEQQFIQESKKYLGVPYLFGGITPSGFDCSGYINYVLKEYGYSVPRTAADMYASSNLTKVSKPEVGDLVFFTTYKPGASHAGIYIGNSEFVHASSSKGISVSKLDESYWNTRYLGAKRLEGLSTYLNSVDAEAKQLWQTTSQHFLTSDTTTQNQDVLSTYNEIRKQADSGAAKEYVLRTAHVIDSVNLSSNLAGSTKQLTDTMITNQSLTDESVNLYHQHSLNIKKSETVFSRLYGSELRKRFNNESITPAKIAKETVIYEVSMYGLLDTIEQTVEAGNLDEAGNLLEKYDRLEKRANEIKAYGNTLHAGSYQSLNEIRTQLEERKKAVEEIILSN
ncbi:NlpC/P60 family protein [Metabacillus litoralis]|uniref:NlpC/P60 family protein n=1 Tax=Metabacillus TaxID=2675233 RepID=UPI001B97DF0E|nr:NlpC/P60 family protein [Metabacillus litoralis]UHA61541.1 NlpC/P60 family protein [Metabacillus litoralis]